MASCKTCWCAPCVCARAVAPVEAPVAIAGPNFQAAAWAPTKPVNLFAGSQPPVEWSDDLRRIMALPRRKPPEIGTPEAAAIVAATNARFRRENQNCECRAKFGRDCIKTLMPVQAWALFEIATAGGIIGSLAVGSGKSIVDLLAPLALPNCRNAVLLCPPGLVEQLVNEFRLVGQHFWMPQLVCHGRVDFTATSNFACIPDGAPVLHVFPYSLLSKPEHTVWLDRMKPDAMFADEVHSLADINSTRTKRVLRFFAENPTTRFAGWTGSLSDGELADYAHLMALALRDNAPTPLDPQVVKEWGRAIDAGSFANPGALKHLCEEGESVRDGFRRRLQDSAGFVHTKHASISARLEITERKVDVPEEVQRVLRDLRATWVRPDWLAYGGSPADGGEEFVDQFALGRCLRELACGFFYRWKFPRGEPTTLIMQWLEARKLWHRELREQLKQNLPHMDSPLLCARAAARAYGDEQIVIVDEYGVAHDSAVEPNAHLPQWRAQCWPAWRDIRDQVRPQSEAVRFNDFLARDAAAWAAEHRGIVWYDKREFGQWVAELSGLPRYGGGPSGGGLLDEHGKIIERGDRSIILSIKAHGTGRDGLQFLFNDQLVANPMASAVGWEQCLDAQTEILTDRGWLGIDAPAWSDPTLRAAAYDIETGAITWSAAQRMERVLGSEAMYGISSPHLDIRVTAGHRMVFERCRRFGPNGNGGSGHRPREFVEASVLPAHGRIPVAGRQEAAGVPLTDAELTFIGLVMTDGHISKSGTVISLFQSERYPDVIALIERTLNELGYKYGRSVNKRPSNFGERSPLHKWTISSGCRPGTEIHGRNWWRLAPYLNKELSPLLADMTREQLIVLLRAMWAGDGNKTPGTYAGDPYTPRGMRIATRRRCVADAVQSLCVRRGIRCNIGVNREPSGREMYFIVASPDVDVWSLGAYASDSRPVWARVSSDPSERVWCATVDTGAIVIRRNHKVAVVGNCLGRLHRMHQKQSVVYANVYKHTEEMSKFVSKALLRAAYITGTLGAAQKVIAGMDEALREALRPEE